MLNTANYWTPVISAIIQFYLSGTTVCVISNLKLDVDLTIKSSLEYFAVVNINLKNLQKSFRQDIVDFGSLERKLLSYGVGYNALTEKLTMAIEQTHCESFLAFEEDIFLFIESFTNASRYSDWRSKRNRFIFGYLNDSLEEHFQNLQFFTDQAAILLVSIKSSLSPHLFNFKTNKYYGPKTEQQYTFVLLDQFNALTETFLYNRSLFPEKTTNLKGREVVVAGIEYAPYFLTYYDIKNNNSYDLAYGDSPEGAVHIEGTDTRILLAFCEVYNCTLYIDSTDVTDWGEVYPNLTGNGVIGMVVNDKAEISIGAMYSWHSFYLQLDMSTYLGRSGITCLVPAPRRLASWLLPLQPFQLTLWLAVLLYLIIEAVSLCFTHQFECRITAQQATWSQSLKFGYVTAIKLFLSQLGNSYVTSLTMRIFLFACFMNDIILTSIYGGGLASILTIPSFGKAADTVDAMFSYKLEWAANSLAWVLTLRTTDDERIKGILNNFHVLTEDELSVVALTRHAMGFAVERLPFGHFAIGDYVTAKSIEHLKIMKEDLYFQYSVAFAKRSWPLMERFDQLVYWWHSAGLDKYWEWRTIAVHLKDISRQKQVEATMYTKTGEAGPEKLGMSNFIGILSIWLVGILISLMVFSFEIMENWLSFKCYIKK